ncbi:hypothetical protein PtB15_2B121 [Puccinia triticina]|nr:hypothetical protein PtB15_2B121 [Puccinia triticina]
MASAPVVKGENVAAEVDGLGAGGEEFAAEIKGLSTLESGMMILYRLSVEK